jgi:tetratricopeptide (TPR) repeat protein
VHPLEESIRQLQRLLSSEPGQKTLSLAADFDQPLTAELVAILQRETLEGENPFDIFAVARFGFLIYRSAAELPPPKLLRHWTKIAYIVGAYQECLDMTAYGLDPELPRSTGRQREQEWVVLLRTRAKALRNLGRFEDALDAYRGSLELAYSLKLGTEVAVGLLQIGKLYGSYLDQQSLYTAFVEEARARLEKELRALSFAASARCLYFLAICHDALGQANRARDRQRALEHFFKAIRLNRRIRRHNGIARAICHASYCLFTAGEDTMRQLRHFEFGIELVSRNPMEERGLGVRWVQYAEMLHHLGRPEAQECLREGKRIAHAYSDFRTVAKACLTEARILYTRDPQRAAQVLQQGRAIAHTHGLLLAESQLNRQLAGLDDPVTPDRPPTPADLFARNQKIHADLLQQVKRNLASLSRRRRAKAEFRWLSPRTRDTFRQGVLLDYERLVQELDHNLGTMIDHLRRSAERQQALLLLAVMNSLARELVHELKLSIPVDSDSDLFGEVASSIDSAVLELRKLSESPRMRELIKVCARLELQAELVRQQGRRMERLKSLLAAQLRRPRVLDQEVSLRDACEQAISELSGLGFHIRPAFDCDILVTSSEDLMVNLVRNLIRNSAEDLSSRSPTSQRCVVVSLRAERIGDWQVGNPAQAAVLMILAQLESEEDAAASAAAIARGLEDGTSDKPYGSGVGLELARTVLGDLMRATLTAHHEGAWAGLRVQFPLGVGSVWIA